MENVKHMPDFLLENVFITMTNLTDADVLKWKIHTNSKVTSYHTVNSTIILENRLEDDSFKGTSTLIIKYDTDTELYLLNNITYPRGSDSYRTDKWDKLYYNLVSSIIQSVLRHGASEYEFINYLAKINKKHIKSEKASIK